jgi:hypothetical protein
MLASEPLEKPARTRPSHGKNIGGEPIFADLARTASPDCRYNRFR